uniref:Uncharacterized protein n=1 Tax=Aegilops tauschii TaxID=37682 RepID=M8BGB0_AEGTA
MENIVQFINQRTSLPLPAALLPELHELHAYGGLRLCMLQYECKEMYVVHAPVKMHAPIILKGRWIRDV